MAGGVSDIFGSLGLSNLNWAGSIVTMAWAFAIFLLVMGGCWFYYSTNKNKKVYVHPIRLIRYLDNGGKKEQNGLRGGKIKVGGSVDFCIKLGRFKKKKLGYIPDMSKMDSDGRLVFLAIGDGEDLQQVEEHLYKGKDGKANLMIKPIPSETKTATLNNLRNWREILDAKKLTAFGISILAFVFLVIAHLVSLYIQTKIKCPTP